MSQPSEEELKKEEESTLQIIGLMMAVFGCGAVFTMQLMHDNLRHIKGYKRFGPWFFGLFIVGVIGIALFSVGFFV